MWIFWQIVSTDVQTSGSNLPATSSKWTPKLVLFELIQKIGTIFVWKRVNTKWRKKHVQVCFVPTQLAWTAPSGSSASKVHNVLCHRFVFEASAGIQRQVALFMRGCNIMLCHKYNANNKYKYRHSKTKNTCKCKCKHIVKHNVRASPCRRL